ncbi:MAG: Uma2 family endonuclease [Deltaproteobacteria bacterium]|nr:Uma2 family endonuclease [Deltaproteobacteria bacterium]
MRGSPNIPPMVTGRVRRRFTVDEYLQLERSAAQKSELVEGEVYAMTGATFRHSRIAANVVGAVQLRLRGKPCQPCGNDLRVLSAPSGLVTYPDVSVVCGQPVFHEPGPTDTLLNPTAIFEVLSPSTEAFDRGEKSLAYRAIPSLRHYVLLSQDRPLVEVYSRVRGEAWPCVVVQGEDAVVELAALEVTLPLRELYADLP